MNKEYVKRLNELVDELYETARPNVVVHNGFSNLTSKYHQVKGYLSALETLNK